MHRGQLTQFVDRYEVVWELSMGALSLIFLALAVVDDDSPGSVPLVWIVLLSAIFLVEFGARYLDAVSRWTYLRTHWVDLVACVPLVGALRATRLLRLLRLVRLGAGHKALSRAQQRRAEVRGSIWFLMPTLVLVWIVGAGSIWVLEHGVNRHIQTFGDALYWSFITATTAAYGDTRPVTSGGRIIAGILIFIAIGLIGITASRLTATLVEQDVAGEQSALDEEIRQLRGVIAELGTRYDPAPLQQEIQRLGDLIRAHLGEAPATTYDADPELRAPEPIESTYGSHGEHR